MKDLTLAVLSVAAVCAIPPVTCASPSGVLIHEYLAVESSSVVPLGDDGIPLTHTDVPDLPPPSNGGDGPANRIAFMPTPGDGPKEPGSGGSVTLRWLAAGLDWAVFVPWLDAPPVDLPSAGFAPLGGSLPQDDLGLGTADLSFGEGFGDDYPGSPVAVPTPAGSTVLMLSGLGFIARRPRR